MFNLNEILKPQIVIITVKSLLEEHVHVTSQMISREP